MANFYRKSSQLGRSMIEMLGVLSIIGVLSIASISAYSQAMFKYQLTAQAEAFNLLLQRAIELLPTLQREYGRQTTNSHNVAQIMADTGMLPNGIYHVKGSNSVSDLLKNQISILYSRSAQSSGGYSTDYYITFTVGSDGEKMNKRGRAICRNVFSVVQNSAAQTKGLVEVRSINASGTLSGSPSGVLRGERLYHAGIAEIDRLCGSCDSAASCGLVIYINSVQH